MHALPLPSPAARSRGSAAGNRPRTFSGGFIGGVPPVPIPNTEVKPSRADGTARFPCGRVGRCRNIIETPRRPILGRGALLFPAVHRSPVVPPVPIPNTEVKPARCDGTARFPCGRVGRCRNIIETPRRPILGRGALLFGWGFWVEVDRAAFGRYLDLFKTDTVREG